LDNIDFGVAYIKQPSESRVKITLNTFNNETYVHIREYQLDGDTGKLYPTKSGYALLAEEVDSVIELLNEASIEYTKMRRSLGTDTQLSFPF
tara:strand:+ start:16900 stop:17175 length:276 start_codon:yes stop_codon:yes gene_type:complete